MSLQIPERPVDARPFGGLTFGLVVVAGAVLMVALAVMLPRLPVPLARKVVGLTQSLSMIAALSACLNRAHRFPQESKSWRLFSWGLFAALVANALLVGVAKDLSRWGTASAWSVGLQFLATMVMFWAVQQLPMVPRDPERGQLHWLGALLFGSSLALLLWILGFWRAQYTFIGPEQGLLANFCLRAALLGGAVVYQVVDNPGRLRGPMAWLLGSATLGVLPGLLGLAQLTAAPGRLFPLAAGFFPLGPLTICLMALHPSPMETTDPVQGRPRLLEGLLYLPYLASAVWLLHALASGMQHFLLPLLGFLVVTTLLVVHQFVLLQEVRSGRNELDARVQDRTKALMELQAIMLRTERMNNLGLLGAGLTHDLANSLMTISASADLVLEAQEENRPVSQNYLLRIKAAALHSAKLSSSLMAFVRKESSVETLQDLALLVMDESDLIRMLLPNPITLSFDIQEEDYPIFATQGQIQQILVNLVANACDAISGAGFIRIGLVREIAHGGRPTARLEVEDTGCGMPEEVLEHVFKPLFTTKPLGKGTGLGLASVKAILEQLGGEIDVQSALGKGTTFRLLLPLNV